MKNIKQVLLVIAGAIIGLWMAFGSILFHPNEYIFSGAGDGIKNYYTTHYYVKYGESGSAHFTGLNYPFGEHLVFCDAQPALALLLKWVNTHVVSIDNQVIGILNFLMLISILVAALGVFFILRKLNIAPKYAIIGSWLIAFLAPQIERFTGHYALSYVCFVPFIWLFLLNFFSSNKSIWLGAIVIWISLFGFLHPYYLLIGAVFVLAYFIANLILSKQASKAKWMVMLKGFIAAIVPLILFYTWLNLTNTIADRPQNPWGMMAYRAKIEGLFFPVYDPLLSLFKYFILFDETNIESRNYVGLATVVLLLFALIKTILWRYKRKRFRFPFLHSSLKVSLLTAILCLAFAMAIPFSLGLESLRDFVPLIKQFRSLGRFAWIFYFIVTTISIYTLTVYLRFFAIKRMRFVGRFVVGLLLFIWFLEAVIHVKYSNQYIQSRSGAEWNAAYATECLQRNGHEVSEFQAILPLPYYHIGSERIGVNGTARGSFQSMKWSIQTGLPIYACMLSRTSLEQSMQQISLFSNRLMDYQSILPNKKPLLIIYTGEGLREEEQQLLSRADSLFTDGDLQFFVLTDAAIQHAFPVDSLPHQLASITEQMSSNDPNAFYYAAAFDQQESAHVLEGKGALHLQDGKSMLFDQTLEGKVKDTLNRVSYECSFWVYVNTNQTLPILHYKEIERNTGNPLAESEIRTDNFYDFYKGWIRVHFDFSPAHPENKVQLFLTGENYFVDELLIRKKDAVTLDRKGTGVWLNNFPANKAITKAYSTSLSQGQ